MTLLEQLNGNWESRLTGLDAQLWQTMKAIGVTAQWVDPLKGQDVKWTEELNGQARDIPGSDFYEFVVQYQGKTLVHHTKHRADYDLVALTGIINAATQLEQQGHRLIPPLR